MSGEPEPRPMALPGVHDALLERIGGLEPGRALDLPAGQGALSAALLECGWQLTSADIDPGRFRVEGQACLELDMDRPLPFDDASFELVVCAEGIEHCENAYQLVRELTRVLAPGGRLLLSTPNPLNLASRLRAFLTGFSDVSPRPIRADEPRLSEHHINPVRLQFLELMLRRNGLQVLSLGANRMRRSAVLLALMFYPWVWLATAWVLHAPRRPEPMPAVSRRLRKLLLSPAALLGRVLVVEAVRQNQ